MLNPQEKLRIIRQAETNPGSALLAIYQMLSDEITAQLGQISKDLQKASDAKHEAILETIKGISSNVDKAIGEIKSSVEKINAREIDEDKIIEGLAGKIEMPEPIPGHTPTQEELLALIVPLIPKKGEDGQSVSQERIRQMIEEAMPEAGKPMSEEEIIAIMQPVIESLKTGDEEKDKKLAQQIAELERQVALLSKLPRSSKDKKSGKYLHGGGSGGISGSQEKSSTIPNGVLQTFAFVHVPTIVLWNGQVQTMIDDYTASGLSITFTGTNIPVIGDKIINIYG